MILKYIRRRIEALQLEEHFQQQILDQTCKYEHKYRSLNLSKGDTVVKISLKLLKHMEKIEDAATISQAEKLLDLLRGLVSEINDRDRAEVWVIKVKAYLLNVWWHTRLRKPIDRLIQRICLFLH